MFTYCIENVEMVATLRRGYIEVKDNSVGKKRMGFRLSVNLFPKPSIKSIQIEGLIGLIAEEAF